MFVVCFNSFYCPDQMCLIDDVLRSSRSATPCFRDFCLALSFPNFALLYFKLALTLMLSTIKAEKSQNSSLIKVTVVT